MGHTSCICSRGSLAAQTCLGCELRIASAASCAELFGARILVAATAARVVSGAAHSAPATSEVVAVEAKPLPLPRFAQLHSSARPLLTGLRFFELGAPRRLALLLTPALHSEMTVDPP